MVLLDCKPADAGNAAGAPGTTCAGGQVRKWVGVRVGAGLPSIVIAGAVVPNRLESAATARKPWWSGTVWRHPLPMSMLFTGKPKGLVAANCSQPPSIPVSLTKRSWHSQSTSTPTADFDLGKAPAIPVRGPGECQTSTPRLKCPADRGTRSHMDVMEAGTDTARVQDTMHVNRLDRLAQAV